MRRSHRTRLLSIALVLDVLICCLLYAITEAAPGFESTFTGDTVSFRKQFSSSL